MALDQQVSVVGLPRLAELQRKGLAPDGVGDDAQLRAFQRRVGAALRAVRLAEVTITATLYFSIQRPITGFARHVTNLWRLTAVCPALRDCRVEHVCVCVRAGVCVSR
eukprot:COSAG05_NODE_4430_length_1519_cov_9.932015_2_plen_108_part_00